MAESLQELKESVEEEINGIMGRIVDDRDAHDEVMEIASSYVPDGCGTLADMLAADTTLGSVSDSGLLDNPQNVWDIIRASADEQLRSHAVSHFEAMKKEFEDDKDDLENEGLEIDRISRRASENPGKYQIIKPEDEDEGIEEVVIHGPFDSEYDAVQWWKKEG